MMTITFGYEGVEAGVILNGKSDCVQSTDGNLRLMQSIEYCSGCKSLTTKEEETLKEKYGWCPKVSFFIPAW